MGAKFGQHFLKATWAVKLMADTARLTKDDTIVEIGPGKGVLTKELLARGARVIAFEIDPEMIKVLEKTFKQSLNNGSLTLIHKDVLDDSISLEEYGLESEKYKVIANIPYYITGAIVRMFLAHKAKPSSMTLLVQKEVAERIARDTKESILSLSVKVFGTPKYIKTVKARDFSPPPKVDSAILSVENIKDPFENEEGFFNVVKTGFASKRKLLANNLSTRYEKERVLSALSICGVHEKVRAEDVPLEKWRCLTRELKNLD